MLPPDLAQVVEQYHRALEAYVAGDADPVLRLFSRRDDVTLANPVGPPVRGWHRVDEAARRAGAQVRAGEDNHFERISEFATADLGYIVEIHRARAKLGGAAERSPFALRITTIFRREDGEWRIAHRHADPITAPRPIESVREQ
jgi:ketosteroid isomerase-like protein